MGAMPPSIHAGVLKPGEICHRSSSSSSPSSAIFRASLHAGGGRSLVPCRLQGARARSPWMKVGALCRPSAALRTPFAEPSPFLEHDGFHHWKPSPRPSLHVGYNRGPEYFFARQAFLFIALSEKSKHEKATLLLSFLALFLPHRPFGLLQNLGLLWNCALRSSPFNRVTHFNSFPVPDSFSFSPKSVDQWNVSKLVYFFGPSGFRNLNLCSSFDKGALRFAIRSFENAHFGRESSGFDVAGSSHQNSTDSETNSMDSGGESSGECQKIQKVNVVQFQSLIRAALIARLWMNSYQFGIRNNEIGSNGINPKSLIFDRPFNPSLQRDAETIRTNQITSGENQAPNSTGPYFQIESTSKCNDNDYERERNVKRYSKSNSDKRRKGIYDDEDTDDYVEENDVDDEVDTYDYGGNKNSKKRPPFSSKASNTYDYGDSRSDDVPDFTENLSSRENGTRPNDKRIQRNRNRTSYESSDVGKQKRRFPLAEGVIDDDDDDDDDEGDGDAKVGNSDSDNDSERDDENYETKIPFFANNREQMDNRRKNRKENDINEYELNNRKIVDGEKKKRTKNLGISDDIFYDKERASKRNTEFDDVYDSNNDSNSWMIDERGYFSDKVEILPPEKNLWKNAFSNAPKKGNLSDEAQEIDLPLESAVDKREERREREKRNVYREEEGDGEAYEENVVGKVSSKRKNVERRLTEDDEESNLLDTSSRKESNFERERKERIAEKKRVNKVVEKRQREEEEEEEDEERLAVEEFELSMVGKAKFENAKEIFDDLVNEANELLRKGRQGLLGKIQVELSADLLTQSTELFTRALELFPSSLAVVGQRGNALLAHGELKLKFSRQLRIQLAQLTEEYEREMERKARKEKREEDSSKKRLLEFDEDEFTRENEEWRKERETRRTLRAILDAIVSASEESEELLIEAGRCYRNALSMDKNDFRALYNWGLALCYRGQLISDEREENYVENADRLFLAAIDKFEAMLSLSDNWRPGALLNWGLAVRDRSRLRPLGSRERVRLLEQSRRLLEQANQLEPGNEQARAALVACDDELAQLAEMAQRLDERRRREEFPPRTKKWWFG